MASLPVAILSGGLGTRLYPITQQIPKALVPVAGKPFVEYQFELLRRQGIERVVMCVGHMGEMIQLELGDGSQFGLTVEYIFDGGQLLGTGGAIKNALPLLGPEFFVLYGDSYLPISFSDVADYYPAAGKLGIMTVHKNEGRWDTSNVWFRAGEIVEYNKKQRRAEMEYIDYGLSVFSAAAFDAVPAGTKVDLADVMVDLVNRRQLAGFEVKERFYEVGSAAGLKEFEELIVAGQIG